MCGKKFKSFLAGSIIFGAIGTAIGVLFAPRKGKELRKKLQDEHKKGGDVKQVIKSDLKIMANELKQTAKELKDSSAFKDMADKGHHKAKEILNLGYEKLKNLAEKAGVTLDELLGEDFDIDEFREDFRHKTDLLKNQAHKASSAFKKAKSKVNSTINKAKNKLKK